MTIHGRVQQLQEEQLQLMHKHAEDQSMEVEAKSDTSDIFHH